MSNQTKFGSRARRAANRTKRTARELFTAPDDEAAPITTPTQAPDIQAVPLEGAENSEREESK